MNKDIAFNKII